MDRTTTLPPVDYEYDWNDSSKYGNQTGGNAALTPLDLFSALLYIVIFLSGLVGNLLVIFVVLRYTKMKTVTNTYILNLAVADVLFLIELPILVTTMIVRGWLFGNIMCKVFHILTSVNWFVAMFTLTVMSGDRFMAVCHPVTSVRYRTPFCSRVVCVIVWAASFLVMLPVILYAKTIQRGRGNLATCTIVWPDDQIIPPEKAFVWYAFLLGFAIPVALISVFYSLVVFRLKTVGPKKKSKEKKRSQRKVTRLVLAVVLVYIFCWLPYWVFQVHLAFVDIRDLRKYSWKVDLFQIITVFSYTNSMLNPLLYAFFSDNFKKSFMKAFACAGSTDVNSVLTMETSMMPKNKLSCRNNYNRASTMKDDCGAEPMLNECLKPIDNNGSAVCTVSTTNDSTTML